MQSNIIKVNNPLGSETSEDTTKLPFTLQDLKAAIPAEYFQTFPGLVEKIGLS
ncbi:MAG: hypothetical protein V7L29_27245 [Nostoc sp.]|uniref:hypothetical protein n=1 Tax=Nostoc sp. TaxID=1180 RepID=UPI002FFB4F38